MNIAVTTITADKIAAFHMIDWPVAAVEFHNGNMLLADVEDMQEHGECFSLGLPVKKFPRKMSHKDRVAYMAATYRDGR